MENDRMKSLEEDIQKTIGDWADKHRNISEKDYCLDVSNALNGILVGIEMRLGELEEEEDS